MNRRGPLRVPLGFILMAVVAGGLGLVLARSALPLALQVGALGLITLAAVGLLFGLGGLLSFAFLALFRDGDGKDER